MNVGKVAVSFRVVKAVADDEAVVQGESDVIRADGNLAAREISESIRRGEFSFRGYRRRVMRSALGQTLIARWVIANVIYPLKWRWFQILLWRILKPIVILVAWIFVLNWGKRMPTP